MHFYIFLHNLYQKLLSPIDFFRNIYYMFLLFLPLGYKQKPAANAVWYVLRYSTAQPEASQLFNIFFSTVLSFLRFLNLKFLFPSGSVFICIRYFAIKYLQFSAGFANFFLPGKFMLAAFFAFEYFFSCNEHVALAFCPVYLRHKEQFFFSREK